MLIRAALQRSTLSCSRSARSRVISSRRRTTLVVRLASPHKRECCLDDELGFFCQSRGHCERLLVVPFHISLGTDRHTHLIDAAILIHGALREDSRSQVVRLNPGKDEVCRRAASLRCIVHIRYHCLVNFIFV